MRTNAKLTPVKAVLIGHAIVTLPVFVIIAVTALTLNVVLSHSTRGASTVLIFEVGVLLGAALGWLWWSLCVPRWRDWAERNGADEEQTQSLAQRTFLVWPKGNFFERTEFRRRNRR